MWRWLVVLIALGGTGCSLLRREPAPPPVIGGVQTGVASWYGPGFHGRPTASGERFDQWKLTAAHRTLPFGTRAMVTSLDNGRSVEVRINDRGPFVGGRIVDLSRAAAQSLHMIGPGLMRVRLEVLDTGAYARDAVRARAAPARRASYTPTPARATGP